MSKNINNFLVKCQGRQVGAGGLTGQWGEQDLGSHEGWKGQ